MTDVREGFDFLGYRVEQTKIRPAGHHVGMLFIPKSKSQLLRDKIKAKVRKTPTGLPLAALIDDLNPVIIGWRNYYRYASRAWREFDKLDWWLHWRIKSWLGKKHGKVSGATLRRLYAERKDGERNNWRMGNKKIALFSKARRMLFPDRGLRIPNGWNATPDEWFLKGDNKFWEATSTLAKL